MWAMAGAVGWGSRGLLLGPAKQPLPPLHPGAGGSAPARVPPQCLAPARPARSSCPRLLSWFLSCDSANPRPFLCPPHPDKRSPNPGATHPARGEGCDALRIHLLLFNRLSRAAGRARPGTSTRALPEAPGAAPGPVRPLVPRAGVGGSRRRGRRSPRPRTGAFWSSAPARSGSPQANATSAPQHRLPRLPPPPGSRRSRLCPCVRVAPGPEGRLYRDALPAGLCTYCKKQLFESCWFWVLFSSPSGSLHPALPSWKGGARWGGRSRSAHFSSALGYLGEETGPARPSGTGTGRGARGSRRLLPPPAAVSGRAGTAGTATARRGWPGWGGGHRLRWQRKGARGRPGAAPLLPTWVPVASPFRC